METLGAFEIKVDSKGRLPLPANLLPVFQGGGATEVFITRGTSDYLMLYDQKSAQVLEESIMQLNGRTLSIANAQRRFLGYMRRVQADTTHRILLPKILREKAYIQRETILLCFKSRYELWSKEIFDKQFDGDLDVSGPEFEGFRL